jgi:GWxTD domain-containing protein
MNALQHFVASPLAQAIGWTILHSLWQGALLATLLGLVMLAIPSPRVRYVGACAAMLLMVIAFGATLVYFLPAGTPVSHAPHAPFALWRAPEAASPAPSWYSNLTAAVPWFAPFWFAGVLLIYVRALAGCLLIQRLRRRGICSPPARWQSELSRLSALLRLSRPVCLLESSFAEIPLLLGHFRPLILIPAGMLSGLPPSQIEAILLHELAHIRRHDYLLNALQRLVEGLFFYHPAIWWISSVIRTERENCCDDIVVGITANPREYAKTLAALEQYRFSGRQPALAVTGGRLMNRIHRLLYPKTQVAWAPLLVAATLLTAGAISLAAWQSDRALHGPSTGAGGQDAKSADTLAKVVPDAEAIPPGLEVYARWVHEEVTYIIDDAERAAFRGLQTNAERDKFIEQFWERRNPTPGSPTNAFKTEHYRRIAYTNQHFGMPSGVPGWQTDRGHMYIVYGPPDEIDSHPKQDQKPAIEYWLYRHIEGVGDNETITFIDRTGHGDYHITPGGPSPA